MENFQNLCPNMKLPKISVIMSVYNGEKYLKEAIESILNQTFKDFEFIIINDGSIDGTTEILEKYDRQDARVKIINQENMGLTKSLNKGIKLAKGEYIARMDADDIALPERFEKQTEFMKKYPEIGAVGCWYYLIDKDGEIIKKCRPPTKFSEIKKALLSIAPLIHPGTMFKKRALQKVNFYDESFKYAQDRDLLLRILKYYQLSVVPEFLFKFRYTKESISLQKEIEQKKCGLKAITQAIKNGIYPKWYYIFTLRYLISIYLPKPLKSIKDKIFNKIGLRYDQR